VPTPAEANRAPSSLCGTPTFPPDRLDHEKSPLPRRAGLTGVMQQAQRGSETTRTERRGERAGQIGRRPRMSGQPMPPPADVHAMRPHESPCPSKGDDSGHSRQTAPSARAEGRSADQPHIHRGPCGNMRRHTLTGRRLGASLGSCPPASRKLRTARPPKGLSDPLPGGAPLLWRAPPTADSSRAQISHQQSAGTSHPEEREPRPRRIA